MPDLPTDGHARGRAVAARLGSADWQLDAEPDRFLADAPPDPPPLDRGPDRARLFPRSVAPAVEPPPADRIVEALLFAGGPPLVPATAAAVIRGLTPDRLQALVDDLNRRYRAQNRPYAVHPRAGGYVLAVKPAYRGVLDKLTAGPREARLAQPALDVLSVVAYRQPVKKVDIDAARGADSAGPLRQLVRLGLVAGRADGYSTTPRFLELMKLASLDDLPRLGEAKPVT